MLFFKRAMEAMGRLAELSTEFMSRVVELANGEYELENFSDFLADFIDRSAREIALAICEPGKVRFVVKEIVLSEDGVAYLIRYGLPPQRSAHDFGLEESIYEPRKEALIQAFESGKMVISNNAKHDPRMSYMWEKAWKESIDHVAIMPILPSGSDPPGFFIIVDLVNSVEFFSEHVAFLEDVQKLISRIVADAHTSMDKLESGKRKEQKKLAGAIGHELRNATTAIGGFASRIVKAPDDLDLGKLAYYANIILREARRIEKVAQKLGDIESCDEAYRTEKGPPTFLN